MARYEVHQDEGMNYVKIVLNDETVRAEAGALCYMVGNITMESRLPSIGQFFRATLAEESIVRPTYTGTGAVYLESSIRGFHIFTLQDEPWLLNRGAYWASDNTVRLSAHGLNPWLSMRAGEGIWHFETKVSGTGQVVLTSPGPVEEVSMEDGTLVADGKYVIARTEGISFSMRRATRSWFGRFISGEGLTRVYAGTGKMLVSSVPYWRFAMSLKAAQEK